jgi:hypothetical protein
VAVSNCVGLGQDRPLWENPCLPRRPSSGLRRKGNRCRTNLIHPSCNRGVGVDYDEGVERKQEVRLRQVDARLCCGCADRLRQLRQNLVGQCCCEGNHQRCSGFLTRLFKRLTAKLVTASLPLHAYDHLTDPPPKDAEMLVSDPTVLSISSAPGGRAEDARLREVARELEASFLAVMLKSAGSGAARDALGGGVGEDQFSSFLTAQHARALVDRGGIGLAESLFQALKARRGDA